MEVVRIVTSLLMFCVTEQTLAYPYTRGAAVRNSGWGHDTGLIDYFGAYPTEDQYPLVEYEPRYTYANERPRINKEAMAAWLNAALDEYILNYDTYSDDDGTWYNEMATDSLAEPSTNDDSPMMRFFFNGQKTSSSSPYRYSLEDLENMERRARMEEDDTENQLHALRAKSMSKKSNMPVLGSRMPMAGRIIGRGQKEEAFDIPATSVRRPVFARTITTQPEEDKREVEQKQDSTKIDRSSITTQKPEEKKVLVSEIPNSSYNDVRNSETTPAPKGGVQSETTTQYLRSHYETLKKFLEREREARMNQDMEDELRREKMQKRGMQKRYATEVETLPQQLASLKKKV